MDDREPGSVTRCGPHCHICANDDRNRTICAEERMFGSGDRFEYLQCTQCGCLQLLTVPVNLQDYYGTGYYSFTERSSVKVWSVRRIASRVRGEMVRRGWPLPRGVPAPEWKDWFPPNLSRHSPILDMGCGDGARLFRLKSEGFTNLAGFDPFLDHAIAPTTGITLSRHLKPEWSGQFRLLMYHHSLEHMPDQFQALNQAKSLLAPGGTILVRIPLADSEAFERYASRWVQLDAPRHMYLHTRRSFSLVAAQAGLRIVSVIYDSTGFQFWGSELYARGLPLQGTSPTDHFSPSELEAFAREADALNHRALGDQAVFLLEREHDNCTG